MAKKSKSKFDPEAFLANADGGVTISKYGKGQVVFAQGDPRIPSSTFEKAGSKSRLSPIKVRKRSSRSSKPEISSARVV